MRPSTGLGFHRRVIVAGKGGCNADRRPPCSVCSARALSRALRGWTAGMAQGRNLSGIKPGSAGCKETGARVSPPQQKRSSGKGRPVDEARGWPVEGWRLVEI